MDKLKYHREGTRSAGRYHPLPREGVTACYQCGGSELLAEYTRCCHIRSPAVADRKRPTFTRSEVRIERVLHSNESFRILELEVVA
jgi:hypothetical protein